MKHIIIFFVILYALMFSGCSVNEAGDMFETAQFEELQNNHEHAQELYRKILKEYPESGYAKKAKDRLLELKDK